MVNLKLKLCRVVDRIDEFVGLRRQYGWHRSSV